jgi:hypothetical protein
MIRAPGETDVTRARRPIIYLFPFVLYYFYILQAAGRAAGCCFEQRLDT